jgi:thiamine-monophosphate kinase
VGEFELLETLRARLHAGGDRVLVGSGDDAAVVRPAGAVSVTSVDAFVEDVHFRPATTSLRDLGHKCMAAGLSDLAAMGATAGEAYVTVGLPSRLGEREVVELADGAAAVAQEHGAVICGGDLTRAGELFVAVTVVGYAPGADALATRAGARPGDLLGVTGTLGGAGAGLLLQERKPSGIDTQVAARLLERQQRPRPLLAAGRALAAAGATAMIDVSDGVASDALRLCEQSGVGIDVHLESLPVEEGVGDVATAVRVDPVEIAAAAGEDYELLFTAPADRRDAIERAAAACGSPVTWIGHVRGAATEGEESLRLLDETARPRRFAGWDHLRTGPGRTDSPGPASR